MRKSIKRLTLNRETIVGLDEGRLVDAGGMSTVLGCTTGFPTRNNCTALTNCATICIACQTATNCISGTGC